MSTQKGIGGQVEHYFDRPLQSADFSLFVFCLFVFFWGGGGSSSFFFFSWVFFSWVFSFLNSILLHACLQILLIICNRCVPVMPFLFPWSPDSEWDDKPVNLLVRLCVLQILTAANGLTEVLFFFLLLCCSSVWSLTQSEWRLKTWVSNQHSKHSVFSLFFCLVCVPAFGRMSALLHETSISSPMGVGVGGSGWVGRGGGGGGYTKTGPLLCMRLRGRKISYSIQRSGAV